MSPEQYNFQFIQDALNKLIHRATQLKNAHQSFWENKHNLNEEQLKLTVDTLEILAANLDDLLTEFSNGQFK